MSRSPSGLTIRPRPLFVDRDIKAPRWWLNNDPFGTAVMTALSLTFPEGERFFIQSVKRLAKDLPEPLAHEVRAFTVQEGAHTREHVAFNQMIAPTPELAERIEALVVEMLSLARSRPPLIQLAVTVGLEHFTASFAHQLLKDDRMMDGVEPGLARLWQWHSIEEVEHKGVAYDVFMHAARDLSPWKRWAIRRWTMMLTTQMFLRTVRKAALMLLAHDGITGARARIGLWRWLWINPGLYRRVALDYLSFYRPAFHPWQVDDRHLITEAETRLSLG